MPATERPTKITFAELREQGVHRLLIYCADCRCSISIAISGDAWRMMSGCPIWSSAAMPVIAGIAERTCIATRLALHDIANKPALAAAYPVLES